MKRLLKLFCRVAALRGLLRVLAGASLLVGVPFIRAQQTVLKYSGQSGSLSNTLLADLQVANGRTLTVSSYGALVLGSGSTLSLSGVTLSGSFSLSGATLYSPTITNAAVISTSGAVTLNGTNIINGGTATFSTSTLTTSTISTASISTASVSTQTVAGTFRAIGATSGFGYGAGSGGTVAQTTSKSNAVTLNAVSGQITLNSYSLSSLGTVSFTLTNSAIASTDVIFANVNSASYSARFTNGGTGTATATITNQSGVTASDSPVVTFIVIKASSN